MNERNEIKWQPFNSIISSQEMLKELEAKRNLQKMPLLSEDEKEYLEMELKRAYHTHEKIKVIYFWKNQFFTKLGYIEYIDIQTNKVYFQDHSSIYFEQLINIKQF